MESGPAVEIFILSSRCFYRTLPQRVVLINVYTVLAYCRLRFLGGCPARLICMGPARLTSPFFRTPYVTSLVTLNRRVVSYPLTARGGAAMALLTLSDDALGVVFEGLRNVLDPRVVVQGAATCKGLRALTQALLQQLRANYEVAVALCRKMGMRSCKELREAKAVNWFNKRLTAADLATLATLVLPALERLTLHESSAGAVVPDGVQRLEAGLSAAALPSITPRDRVLGRTAVCTRATQEPRRRQPGRTLARYSRTLEPRAVGVHTRYDLHTSSTDYFQSLRVKIRSDT